MAKSFGLPATCLLCAGGLQLVNSAGSGTFAVAILACELCKKQWEVSMRMTRHAAQIPSGEVGRHVRADAHATTRRIA